MYRCLTYLVIVCSVNIFYVGALRGAHCASQHRNTKYNDGDDDDDDDEEDDDDCPEGYYCCKNYNQPCCPKSGVGNIFYIWILVVSSVTLLIFVTVMACYWCSCCPIYKRRARRRNEVERSQPTNMSGNPPPFNPNVYPQAEANQQVTSLQQHPMDSSLNQETMFPQSPETLGVAPPYSRHPILHQIRTRGAVPYEILQPANGLSAPSAPPIYPDEPPPRYTP